MYRRLLLVGVFSLLTISCGRVGFDALAVEAVDAGAPDAEDVCNGGVCALTCDPGLLDCAGACTDSDTDSLNCGACDDGLGSNTCAGTEACSVGTCLALVPRELLGNGDFETGELAPWTTANNPVNDNDTTVVWSILAGQATNNSSFGPSAKILTQDFVVPNQVYRATFVLDFFQDGFAFGGEETGLDPENVLVIEKDPYDVAGGIFQNAFRIDIIDPAFDQFYAPILYEVYAPAQSVGAIDALETVFIDDPGLLTFLQSRTGQSLRLRVSQVESTFPWPILVDNLSLSTLTF
jgi:hypothetical protein